MAQACYPIKFAFATTTEFVCCSSHKCNGAQVCLIVKYFSSNLRWLSTAVSLGNLALSHSASSSGLGSHSCFRSPCTALWNYSLEVLVQWPGTIGTLSDSVAHHLLLGGGRLAIAQFADSVAPHLLLCSHRLPIAEFADSVACHLLLCGSRLAI